MSKSSIHIQKASGGAITHNSRENYSKSVVFTDEKNELWNNKKEAYEIYRSELVKRVEAYTNRTNQKLQKTAVTHLSAVVNLEQHHTLKDLEKIKDELEKVFDTKVFQMAIHRDEGKLKHKETGEYLVSGTDFFYNEKDNKYYTKKRVENKQHIFENELNINEYEIEKNYHAHIEMMGLDSQGQAIRQKMNRFVLSNLQDFTALSLNMERGNLFTNNKSNKRLDTHEFKASKKQENEVKKIVKKEKNRLVTKANEIIRDERTQKKTLKAELETLKEDMKVLREDMKVLGGFKREDYAKVEALGKILKNKNISINEVIETIEKIEDLRKELFTKDEKIKELEKEVYHPTILTTSKNRVKYSQLAENYKTKYKIIESSNNHLKEQNKALQEQKEVLANRIIVLEDNKALKANMSDYDYVLRVNEDLKRENEYLKKENATLKEKIKSIISLANEKIKSLFKFKIFNDVKLGYERLNLKDWEKECDNDIRLENRYQEKIEDELLKEEISLYRDISKSKLDSLKSNSEELFAKLEKSKELIERSFGKVEKKQEEYNNHRNNWDMQR